MGKFYRVAYIPMPKLTRATQLEALLSQAAEGNAGFSAMEGLDFRQAWNLYQSKQNEIETAGVELVKRFQRKDGKGSSSCLRYGERNLPLRGYRGLKTFPTVLYVHCHGNSEKVGFAPLYLTPAQLAKRLQDDGLDKNGPRLSIKLWSCHSGEPFGGDGPIYAQAFTNALRGLSYFEVDVFGYVGALRVGDDVGAHKTAELGDGRKVRARTSRVPFSTGSAPDSTSEATDDDDGIFM